ncbi:MAG: serpin family protein, partial [Planctomycetota bacterium]|nr:serpin family protein [Planctomycetota bacterium]
MNRRFWVMCCAFVAALFVFQGWSIAEKEKADHLCPECAKKEAPSVTGKRMLKAVLQCEECGDMIATSMAPDDYKLCDSCAGKKGVCKWCLKRLDGRPANEGPDRTLVQGNNTFAFDLYARLREDKGNLFLSPASISTALAMTYAGARGNTEAEMAKTLHFELEQAKLHPAFAGAVEYLNAGGAKGGYQLTIANSLWGQKGYGFLPEFTKLTKDNYGAGF